MNRGLLKKKDDIYNDSMLSASGKKTDRCCSFEALCSDRSQWWFNLGVALMVIGGICGVVAIAVSGAFASRTLDATSQKVYAVTHQMFTHPLNHVLTSSAPVNLILPNDLTPYIGSHYTIDCETGAAHEVSITAGSLPTVWQAGTMLRTATCIGGTSGRSGFSFRVISASHVRVTEESNMAFSA
jgi:hypothetical protein